MVNPGKGVKKDLDDSGLTQSAQQDLGEINERTITNKDASIDLDHGNAKSDDAENSLEKRPSRNIGEKFENITQFETAISRVVTQHLEETNDPQEVSADRIPDGGLQAWLNVIAGSFSFFVGFGLISTAAVFQSYYKQHQLKGYSPSTVSWISTVQPFLMMILGPLFGRLFDIYGTRPMLPIGSFCAVFSMLMLSLCKEYYQIFLTQGVLFGVGNSLIFFTTTSCVSHWFRKKRAIAMSIVQVGSSLGGVIWPIALKNMLNSSLGFGWSIRIVAFIMIPCVMVPNLFSTARFKASKRGPLLDFSILESRLFLIVAAATFFSFWAYFIPVIYVSASAVKLGMDEWTALYLCSVLNAGSAVGRIVAGYFADKVGRMKSFAVCALISGIINFCWFGVYNKAGTWFFALFYGLSSGAIISLQAAFSADIAPTMDKIGTTMGMMSMFIGIADLTGSPIAGAIVARQQGSYNGAYAFAGSSFVTASLLTVWAVRERGKLKALKKQSPEKSPA